MRFSRDIRRIRSRISRSIFGRPGFPFLDFQRQYSLKPCRCQATTVCGWTSTRHRRQFLHNLESHTQKMRSPGRRRALDTAAKHGHLLTEGEILQR